ncbi:uracil-DNA glycosylase family protein [Pseudomonas fluorescens]|uniref:uracil-DNA glycosylase family protein n=1 Tax=Pseudomonas fluorescens TaxID=294 RepID=UPI0009B6BD9C|nr:uracil-DNA glycosylase family protein [Pseudomonas fluorescens]
MSTLESLLKDIRKCTLCAEHLPLGPRPVVQASESSRILIVGQAPGRKVHASGVPFDDASGERLRDWMGVSKAIFYDPEVVAIVPMGFCYPGSGKSGDLAPRPECAPAWRERLLSQLKNVELTLVIGQYAQAYHLPGEQANLTELVRDWRTYSDGLLPLPHPSPRNNIWLKRNPWFEEELLPELRLRVREIYSGRAQ